MTAVRGQAPERSILTLAQACDYLQLSDKTLRGIIAAGKLAASKVGASWRIRSEDIDLYLDAQRYVPPTSFRLPQRSGKAPPVTRLLDQILAAPSDRSNGR